jgi:cytochrome c peroxidase
VLVDTGRALAAFMEGLSSGRAPFDEFRDALVNGDTRQAAQYSEAAQRGLKLFIGKAACATCHNGPIFTNGERRDNGVGPGQFRVASLRHLALTGPYMHDGSRTSLIDVLDHYERANGADVQPQMLAAPEKRDLLVFLESLTNFRAAIWRSTDGGPACR